MHLMHGLGKCNSVKQRHLSVFHFPDRHLFDKKPFQRLHTDSLKKEWSIVDDKFTKYPISIRIILKT